MTHIGIVGPGLMGTGLAQVSAAAGFGVILVGRDGASAAAGYARLVASLERQMARGRITAQAMEELLSRVRPAADVDALAGCELAIEAVVEDRTVKVALLQRMQATLGAGALIASNTSGLPISGLGAMLQHSERFIGLHFFSPVERMPLVEVVRGQATAQATVNQALEFVQRLGKRPIVVRDGPGFFTSRVFAAYLDEAMDMLNEGVAANLIEQAALGCGRAMGPLAVLDEVSLQLNLQQACQARSDGLEERFCRPLARPVLERMVDEFARPGRRLGAGFYDYPAGGARHLWPGLATHFPLSDAQPDVQQVQQRLLHAEAMEATRCLEEGIVSSTGDADLGSLLGLGFPAATGGVLSWVETLGLPGFVAQSNALADRYGERFRPSPWLLAQADRGALP